MLTLFAALLFLLSTAIAGLMGKYMVRVYGDKKNFMRLLLPVENFIFRFAKLPLMPTWTGNSYQNERRPIKLIGIQGIKNKKAFEQVP